MKLGYLKYHYYFIVIVYFQANLLSQESSNENLAIHHFMQGEFLLNQGNYALAVLEFQDALNFDPNASTIHISIADAYRRLGRANHAENHLKIAIDLDPGDFSAREMLGHIYLINRDYSAAEGIFLTLSKMDSLNDGYITILADLAKFEENWDLAINYYEKAFELNPQNYKSIENALQICLSAQLFNRAESICLKILNYDSENITYWQTYKQITAYNKNYDNTLNAILEIERISGTSIKLLLEKSAIKEEQSKNEEAVNHLVEALIIDSLHLEVIQRLVALYIDNNNYIDADFYNQKILDNYKDDPSGYINASIIALNNSSPNEAIRYLRLKIEDLGDNYSANYLLGTSYYQIDDLTNSEKFLKNALKLFPGSRASKHTLAMIYDQTGLWLKSDSLYLDLISTDSTDAQAYNNFAYSLVERNANLELALEMSMIANKIVPESSPYLDTLGWIYFKLEQYEKALSYVQKSYGLDDSNPVILEHLADILKATNQSSKANLIYMQAIDIGGDSLSIQKKIIIE